MKIAFFDLHDFEKKYYAQLETLFEVKYFDFSLNQKTVDLIQGYDAACCFVNDDLSATVLQRLAASGLRHIVLRSAGFNHVDLKVAKELNIKVLRVPAYSPNAVAEHAVALLLCMNRKIHKSYYRMKDLNFSLDGLVGFDLKGKTIGIIGCGKIGKEFAKIMQGFSCNILAYDPFIDDSLKQILTYCDLDDLLERSDIISLHAPLNKETKHIINETAFNKMKQNVFIVNTSRGGLLDTRALIRALKKQKIGGAALDVYEEEEAVFFANHSVEGLNDDVLARLLTFPNVLITSHQGFLTHEALKNIADTTINNLLAINQGHELENQV